jgi:hypothetical protein
MRWTALVFAWIASATCATAQLHQPWEIMTDEAVGKKPPAEGKASAVLIEKTSVQGALAILTSAGMSGGLETNPDGSRFVLGKMDQGPFQMLPLECERPGENCASIRLYLGFSMREKPPLQRINQYNSRTKDVRAYIDEDGDPAIEMDIPLAGGVSAAFLTRRLAAWRSAVEGYRAFLGVPAKP